MFRRFSNSQLGITLAVLVVLYGISTAFRGSGESTFSKVLSNIDTTKVTAIVIEPGNKPGEKVNLTKTSNAWVVSLPNGKTVPVADNQIDPAINSLATLEASQLVSRKTEKQAEFKVDTAGTRIQVMEGDKKTLDIVLGRFEYKQSGMSSYVRLSDKNDIYMVPGYLDASFNKDANGWRNKTLSQAPATDLVQLTFDYKNDSSFSLLNTGASWVGVMGNDTLPLDPNKVSTYLNTFSSLQGNEFYEGQTGNFTSTRQLTLQTQSSGFIQLAAYEIGANEYYINSSVNPDANFVGTGIVERVFVDISQFLSGE